MRSRSPTRRRFWTIARLRANTYIRHLILAYNTSIQVFSADDSLLIRKIPLLQPAPDKKAEQVVSICLSPSSPNHVWVASSVGHLWLIDWTNGNGSETAFKLKCHLLMSMTVERMQFAKVSRDVPFTSILKGEQWQLVACDLRESKLHGYKTLMPLALPILNLRSAQDGFALVASSEDNILFGTLKTRAVNSISNLNYEFFTLDCSDEIMCLDVRATGRVHLNRKSQVEAGDEPVLDVVVGCARGPVLLYNDLLPQLRRLHSPKGHRSSLQPRKYHWHRKAVHAVKWSRDGKSISLHYYELSNSTYRSLHPFRRLGINAGNVATRHTKDGFPTSSLCFSREYRRLKTWFCVRSPLG